MSLLMLRSMAELLVAWTLAAGAFVGWGFALKAVLAPRDRSSEYPLFWLGFGAVVGVLQLTQIFQPVGTTTAIVVGAVGWGLLAVAFWAERQTLRQRIEVCAPVLLLFVPIAVWLSNLSLGPDNHPDSGLYYFSTVRWIQTHPLPPGLGNLSYLLAFNNSYFLYVALLDVGPFFEKAQHLANPLLLLAVLWRCAAGFVCHLRRGTQPAAHATVAAFLLVPIVYHVRSGHLQAPFADRALFFIGIALILEVLRLLEERCEAQATRSRMNVVFAMAVLGFVLKPAFFPQAAAAVSVVAYVCWQSARATRFKTLLSAAGVVLFWCIPWLARGVILSGYPLFPSTLLAAPVTWRLDEQVVLGLSRYVKAFARVPGAPVEDVLSDSAWIYRWLSVAWLDNWEFLIPIAIAFTALGVVLYRKAGTGTPAVSLVYWMCPFVLALVLWFSLAPAIRFAGPLLWGVAACAFAAAARSTDGIGSAGRVVTITTTTGLAIAALWHAELWLPYEVPVPVRPPKGEMFETRSGLQVRHSNGGCFDALCSPFKNPDLKLREEGNIAAGFEVAR